MGPEKRKRILGYAILAAGIVCIAAGVYQKEIGTVLNKAINICLECIGIG